MQHVLGALQWEKLSIYILEHFNFCNFILLMRPWLGYPGLSTHSLPPLHDH